MSLLRAWGVPVALSVTVVTGVVGAVFWVDSFAVPQIRLPVPMPLLFPVLSSVMVAWLLVERWPDQLRTAVRPPWLTPTLRFLLAQLTGLLAAVIATAGEPHSVWLHCSVGTSAAAVATALLGRVATMAVLVCGYAWLFVAIDHPGVIVGRDPTLHAVVAFAAAGAVYVSCQARRHTPRGEPVAGRFGR